MPAPSPLVIATQSVQRLVKEEAYYHKELAGQQARVQKLQAELEAGDAGSQDQNAEFVLKQERTALKETQAVFGPLRLRIADAVTKLEEQLAISQSAGDAPAGELGKAQEALKSGQQVAAQA